LSKDPFTGGGERGLKSGASQPNFAFGEDITPRSSHPFKLRWMRCRGSWNGHDQATIPVSMTSAANHVDSISGLTRSGNERPSMPVAAWLCCLGPRVAAVTSARFLVAAVFLLVTTTEAAPRHFRTVVIDAGHGGHDRGGIPGQKVSEKDVALATAKRVESALKDAGIRTIMTRSTDRFVTLGGRVAIANAHRDALFLSIHYNSSTNQDAKGIETYYGGAASKAVAERIHRAVVSGTDTLDRKVRKGRYFVLRRSRIPAVLVECGFLTNDGEAGRAKSTSYQKKIAQKIAEALGSS
jgi:N-acetylmuramoyl-L-alanine amidase